MGRIWIEKARDTYSFFCTIEVCGNNSSRSSLQPSTYIQALFKNWRIWRVTQHSSSIIWNYTWKVAIIYIYIYVCIQLWAPVRIQMTHLHTPTHHVSWPMSSKHQFNFFIKNNLLTKGEERLRRRNVRNPPNYLTYSYNEKNIEKKVNKNTSTQKSKTIHLQVLTRNTLKKHKYTSSTH